MAKHKKNFCQSQPFCVLRKCNKTKKSVTVTKPHIQKQKIQKKTKKKQIETLQQILKYTVVLKSITSTFLTGKKIKTDSNKLTATQETSDVATTLHPLKNFLL